MNRRGQVYLVGAGPGDPAMITVRGLDVLRRADVVVFDRLAPADLLLEVPAGCERIDVGKGRGDAPVSQEQIHELIIDRARRGFLVVRLKGGDPFVFGRGYEELSACRDAGIDCIVVPGVSSAIAVPEAAGISLTLRGVSRSFAVLTAETAPQAGPAIDFSEMRGVDTLVVMMGRGRLERTAQELMNAGWKDSTPVACIQRGTTERQKVVCGTLATIAKLADENDLQPPMVTVIGEVARLADPANLDRSKSRSGTAIPRAPLAGKKILITRPQSAARKLARKVRRAGGIPLVCPLLRIEIPDNNPQLDAAVQHLGEYKWLAFTSMHAVTAFWRRLAAAGVDARRLGGCKIAAIGFATSRALKARGLRPDVTAGAAAALAEELIKASGGDTSRVLWPRGDRALPELQQTLELGGAGVNAPVAYRTVIEEPPPGLKVAGGVDAVLLYSPSAAEALALLALPLERAMIVCVGPTTAQAAQKAGLNVQAIAHEPSDEGLLAALERAFAGTRR